MKNKVVPIHTGPGQHKQMSCAQEIYEYLCSHPEVEEITVDVICKAIPHLQSERKKVSSALGSLEHHHEILEMTGERLGTLYVYQRVDNFHELQPRFRSAISYHHKDFSAGRSYNRRRTIKRSPKNLSAIKAELLSISEDFLTLAERLEVLSKKCGE